MPVACLPVQSPAYVPKKTVAGGSREAAPYPWGAPCGNRLTRPDGKSVSAYYDEESELPLIEHRRGWVELTGDVLHDVHGRALSVSHARNFVVLDEDTIELRNVNLYNVAYRASPPLRFKVRYDPRDELYDLDGEFGISVSASSRSDLDDELQEALSMLWIEYGEESPDRLSPKAQRLRTDLRKRLTAAQVAATYKRATVESALEAKGFRRRESHHKLFRLPHGRRREDAGLDEDVAREGQCRHSEQSGRSHGEAVQAPHGGIPGPCRLLPVSSRVRGVAYQEGRNLT